MSTWRAVPAFVLTHASSIERWIRDLEETGGTIIAISRKGPRLLELLVELDMAPKNLLERTFSEHAIPFLRGEPGPFVVTDDSIIHGSTFDRVLTTARQFAASEESAIPVEVIGIPLALGNDVAPTYRAAVSRHYYSLPSTATSSFVHGLVSSFWLLAKPYDIDHPILDLESPDFSASGAPGAFARALAGELKTLLISRTQKAPTTMGPITCAFWSLPLSQSTNPTRSQFGKIRLYHCPTQPTLVRLVPMQPMTMTESHAADVIAEFAPSLVQFVQNGATAEDDALPRAKALTRVHCANYIYELALYYQKVHDAVERAARSVGIRMVEGERLSAVDGRFLMGNHFEEASSEIGGRTQVEAPPQCLELVASDVSTSVVQAPLEVLPPKYADAYQEMLTREFRSAFNAEDALNAIFYAQHEQIEMPSRKDIESGHRRLQFGVGFDWLTAKIQKSAIPLDMMLFHHALDGLIDSGCVVPRFVPVTALGQEEVFSRMFRVGEGMPLSIVYTMKMLFGALLAQLPDELRSEGTIPATVLEKYATLALSVATPDNYRLQELTDLPLKKAFHLYGARMKLTSGHEEYLIDWATRRGILERSLSAGGPGKRTVQYRLSPQLEERYPGLESPWNPDTHEALEDIAALVAIITTTRGLRSRCLTTLTSVASEEDFARAIEAELRLWLEGDEESAVEALGDLEQLASRYSTFPRAHEQLDQYDRSLQHPANVIRQALIKIDYFSRRHDTYAAITQAVEATSQRSTQRAWTALLKILKHRGENEKTVASLSQLIAVTQIAHATNRLLRDLLSLAGRRSEQSLPLRESLIQLVGVIEGTTAEITRGFFVSDSPEAVSNLMRKTINEVEGSFPADLHRVRPVVLEIVNQCGKLVDAFGVRTANTGATRLDPPLYVVLWDIRESTLQPSRDKLEDVIKRGNARLLAALGKRICDFRPESTDDGNGLICSSLADVLRIFLILHETYGDTLFRMGCDVNLQGYLNYYESSRRLEGAAYGGRAYEYAARLMSFHSEIERDPSRWNGESIELPSSSYLVLGEFAVRYARQNEGDDWLPENVRAEAFDGEYSPRLRAPLPVRITQCTVPA